MKFLREPLYRLLLINLGIGLSMAALMLGGLLALNPGGLRDLLIADRSPLLTAGLLLFGLVITFGSTAMGTAIMMLGRDDGSRVPPEPEYEPAPPTDDDARGRPEANRHSLARHCEACAIGERSDAVLWTATATKQSSSALQRWIASSGLRPSSQ